MEATATTIVADNVSTRAESTDEKTGDRQVCRFISRERFLSLPSNTSYRVDARDGSDWYYGDHAGEAALRQSLADGRPTDAAWKVYQRTKEAMDYGQQQTEARIPKKRKRCWEESGDECDSDRWLTGDSNHWTLMRKVGKRPCITVGMAMWMSCGHGGSDFAENVAGCVALVDQLARSGIMVRIVGIHTAWRVVSGQAETAYVHPLLDYGEPVDEAALMAWGTPGVCRRHGFQWMHDLFRAEGRIDGGMGHGTKTSSAMLKLAGVDILVAKQWAKGADKPERYLTTLFDQACKLVTEGDAA